MCEHYTSKSVQDPMFHQTPQCETTHLAVMSGSICINICPTWIVWAICMAVYIQTSKAKLWVCTQHTHVSYLLCMGIRIFPREWHPQFCSWGSPVVSGSGWRPWSYTQDRRMQSARTQELLLMK